MEWDEELDAPARIDDEARRAGDDAVEALAKVTVELADGSTRMSEVFAGLGYYSQSSAECFFGYADSNPPRRVRVRWPSGEEAEYAVPAGSVTLTLSPPAQ